MTLRWSLTGFTELCALHNANVFKVVVNSSNQCTYAKHTVRPCEDDHYGHYIDDIYHYEYVDTRTTPERATDLDCELASIFMHSVQYPPLPDNLRDADHVHISGEAEFVRPSDDERRRSFVIRRRQHAYRR